jgi:hypothetical protein
VNGVEALGLALGDGFSPDGDDPEAGLVNLGENGAGMTVGYCVWFDDAKSSLAHFLGRSFAQKSLCIPL